MEGNGVGGGVKGGKDRRGVKGRDQGGREEDRE